MTNTRSSPKVTRGGRGSLAPAESDDVNEVRLAGRVAGPPMTRELPSGDVVTMLRIVVDRAPTARRPRGPTSDTVDCAVWGAGLRRRAANLAAGTSVEVQGSLRRRFWRTPGGGPASRYEVEVSSLRRRTSFVPTARGGRP